MAALAINTLLGNQTLSGGLANHNLSPAATKIGDSASVIHRKHYSDSSSGGHHHYSHELSGHPYAGGHQYSEKKGRNIALTALTLLSFLFFLHILQQCLQDQMDDMNPQVVIMQARIKAPRENEAKENEAQQDVAKEAAKQANKRVDEISEKIKGSVYKIDKDQVGVPSFQKADEYQFDKIQVPLKIRATHNGRHR